MYLFHCIIVDDPTSDLASIGFPRGHCRQLCSRLTHFHYLRILTTYFGSASIVERRIW